jgi:hypothetical protein
MTPFTESIVEDAALAWLRDLGYAIKHGPEIAPAEPLVEREHFGQVVLDGRLPASSGAGLRNEPPVERSRAVTGSGSVFSDALHLFSL